MFYNTGESSGTKNFGYLHMKIMNDHHMNIASDDFGAKSLVNHAEK